MTRIHHSVGRRGRRMAECRLRPAARPVWRGANPVELQCSQPTKLEFAVDLETTQALGQPTLIAREGQVIE